MRRRDLLTASLLAASTLAVNAQGPRPARLVEQRHWRHRIGANRIRIEIDDRVEVSRNSAELRKQLAISIWREGAVAHTFDEKSVASNLQKLPCGAHTC